MKYYKPNKPNKISQTRAGSRQRKWGKQETEHTSDYGQKFDESETKMVSMCWDWEIPKATTENHRKGLHRETKMGIIARAIEGGIWGQLHQLHFQVL